MARKRKVEQIDPGITEYETRFVEAGWEVEHVITCEDLCIDGFAYSREDADVQYDCYNCGPFRKSDTPNQTHQCETCGKFGTRDGYACNSCGEAAEWSIVAYNMETGEAIKIGTWDFGRYCWDVVEGIEEKVDELLGADDDDELDEEEDDETDAPCDYCGKPTNGFVCENEMCPGDEERE